MDESRRNYNLMAAFVEHQVNNFASDCVVAPSIVVCGILFPRYQHVRMEQLPISSGSNLIYRRKINNI